LLIVLAMIAAWLSDNSTCLLATQNVAHDATGRLLLAVVTTSLVIVSKRNALYGSFTLTQPLEMRGV
jgi:hypothetical protein